MTGLRNLASALHLLLLTAFITYSCLYTLTYLNQFQPKLLPSPSPAAPIGYGKLRILQDSTEGVIHDTKDFLNQKGYIRSQETEGEEYIDRVNIKKEENIDRKEDAENGYTGVQENFEEEFTERKDESKEENLESEDENTEKYTKRRRKKKKDWPVVLEPSNAAALHEIDFSKYSSEDQEILKSRLSVMDERAKLVGEVCKQQPKGIHTPSGANHLVWDMSHDPNIIWCPNYKVASTSMMMNFLRLTQESDGLKSKKFVRQNEVRELFWSPPSAKEKAEVFKNGVRVIIVRHPFTRILSAYRDKMIKLIPGPIKFNFRSLQKKIIAQYRKENTTTDNADFPTFPEFVQYVIDETRGLKTSRDWRDNVVCWTTYWARCNVCTADFNIIMKLETLAQDKAFLVTLANLTQLKNASSDEWRHLNNVTSHDVAPEYYSKLTRYQILQLYENYKLDFELFGYDIKDYLTLV